MGRKLDYSDDIGNRICHRLMDGESLRTICADPEMPARSTVHLWLIENPHFADQYARAREAQADTYADEILDIADDGSNDFVERERPDGTTYEAVDQENIQRSKLRVDARKWVAAKLKPKKYGDKIDVTSGGEKLAEVDDVTRATRLAAIFAEIEKRNAAD